MGLRSIESLAANEYITILGFKLEWPTNPWQPLCPAFDGRPLRVLAVSPPFVAVQDIQANRYALDSRAYELTKLNQEYAEVWPWVRGVQVAPQEKEAEPKEFESTSPWFPSWSGYAGASETLVNKSPDIQRPDSQPTGCPRCGALMVQRHFNRPEPAWHRICPECGADAGPIDGGSPPQEQGAKE